MYQYLGACFKPYKDSGYNIYIFSSSSPSGKTTFTSNCSRYKSNVAHKDKTTLIVVNLIIGENISLISHCISLYYQPSMKSFHLILVISFHLIDPFATNDFLTFWKFTKLPCVVSMKSLYFLHHRHLQRGF